MILRYAVLIIAALVLTPSILISQGVTTGSITGTIKGKSGSVSSALPGAMIRAVHVATGSVYGAVSKNKGQFLIRGLRPGTYTVAISCVGYKTDTVRGVNVDVGESSTVNLILAEAASTGSEITVSVDRDGLFDGSKNGSGSVISEAMISASPTINRSISDIARMNPYTNQVSGAGSGDGLQGISIMGVNSRYNNFQIDGAVANDVFALGSAGTAGSQANSNFVSLDAIERIRVNVSPYDIRQSGFTGGLVNAITRGGTNTIQGSVFVFGRNQDLVGLSPDANRKPFDSFYDAQLGGRIGGPIVKDKLFYHVVVEQRLRSNPLEVGLNDPRAAVNFPVPAATLQEIIDSTKSRYGYDPGGFNTTNLRNNSTNVITRFDWSIDESNKIQLRHNFTYSTLDRNLSRTATEYSLLSRRNTFRSVNNQTVLQWNASGESISNEMRLSYTRTTDNRILASTEQGSASQFPEVRIQVGPGLNVVFGPERNSQANALDQTILALTNDFSWFLGGHSLLIGSHTEFSSFNNLFIPDYFGSIQFNAQSVGGNGAVDLTNYLNGVPNYLRLSFADTSITGGNPMPRAAWSMIQPAMYLQDEWAINQSLRLTLGTRIEIPIFLTTPFFNERFANSTSTNGNQVFSTFGGRSTAQVPSNQLVHSSRLGFNYELIDDRTMQIRGGIGLFTGRVAGVWLSNQYSGTGVDLYRLEGGANNSTVTLDTIDIRNPMRPNTATLARPKAAIALTDSNWRLPQVLRATAAFDWKIARGVSFTFELMGGRFLNQVVYSNLNLKRSALTFNTESGPVTGISPVDGRPLYSSYGGSVSGWLDTSFTTVILMSSKSAGNQYSVSGQLGLDETNQFIPNLSAMISYTYGRTQDLNSANAATAVSQWTSTDAIDPNNPQLGISSFDMLHRISATGNYKINWGSGVWSTIGFFYSGNSGRPYSFSYAQDYNGDNAVGGNDLIYVPHPDDFMTKIVILRPPTTSRDTRSAEQIWSQMMAFIDANPALKEYQGKVLPRNALREPWQNNLDVTFTHNIPTIDGQSLQLSLTVQNALNLISSSWGWQRYVNFQSANVFGLITDNNAKRDGDNPDLVKDASGNEITSLRNTPFDKFGRIIMTYNEPVTAGQPGVYMVDNFFSRWRMQLGLRYNF